MAGESPPSQTPPRAPIGSFCSRSSLPLAEPRGGGTTPQSSPRHWPRRRDQWARGGLKARGTRWRRRLRRVLERSRGPARASRGCRWPGPRRSDPRRAPAPRERRQGLPSRCGAFPGRVFPPFPRRRSRLTPFVPSQKRSRTGFGPGGAKAAPKAPLRAPLRTLGPAAAAGKNGTGEIRRRLGG